MNPTLRSITKKLMRLLTDRYALQKELVLPRSESEVRRWEAQLGVPASKFKARLAELAAEGFRRRDDYAEAQRRRAASRKRSPRNSGSLKKKQAATRAAMTRAKGRVGHSRNRAKSLRGGRS